MVVAGIDEAGYGPVLGPLVVGCCAFELPDEPASSDIPCLWKRLRRMVGKSRDRRGRKLHINDSKIVYSPATGLKELERSILALLGAGGSACETLEALSAAVAPALVVEMAGYRWYARFDDERFPIEQDAVSVRLMGNALRGEMERAGVRCIHLEAQVVLERRLNAMMEQTRNKSSVLFSTAAIHLDQLLQRFGDRNLTIFCDRQGGREHYGHLLRVMFEEWALEVVEEQDGRAEYMLRRRGQAVRLLFREKAEAQCMSVAVASMLSKYLREALMRRFNAYWKSQLPDVEPTAGYYSDGMRFLADIEQKRKEMGIGDGELIRSR